MADNNTAPGGDELGDALAAGQTRKMQFSEFDGDASGGPANAHAKPECEAVCAEPVCDWKCSKPLCPKPKCELVCENPTCRPQIECCKCDEFS